MTHYLIAFGRTAFIGLILAASLSADPARAQLEELTGQRVRVSLFRTPGGISTSPVGRLIEVTTDSLVLSAEDERVSIPRRAVQRLDVSTGTKRRTGTGALAGLAMGAFALGSVAASENDADSCDTDGEWICFEYTDALAGASGAITGALLGAVVGAAIGSTIQGDRWKSVDLKVAGIAAAQGRPFVPLPSVRLVIRI